MPDLQASEQALASEQASPNAEHLSAAAKENIDALASYQERAQAEVSRTQAAIEALSDVFGSPAYLVFAVTFIVAWVSINLWGWHAGWRHVDEPPFFWLQGIVSSNALLLTVAVLIRQNRMNVLAARRAHLDLHVNLLTEKKISKALELLQQLQQREQQMHHDAQTQELAKPTNPKAILAAIEDSEENVEPKGFLAQRK